MLKTVGNILWWFPCFGFVPAIFLMLVGALFTITIVMAPFGLGLIELGKFYLAPFTRSIVSESEIHRKKKNTVTSVIWSTLSIILFILYLPIGLIISGILFVSALLQCITIVGIPMAIPTIKSLGAVFNPINKICVSDHVKEILDKKTAKRKYRELAGLSSSASSASSSRSPTPVNFKNIDNKKEKNKKDKKKQ